MKITKSELKQIVSESIKRVMNEAGHLYFRDEDGNAYTNSKETWRGVPGTTFIYHGEWSDPEVWYKGHEINANDLEEYMWEEYKNDCFDNETEPNEDDYESWLEKQGTSWIQAILDNFDTLNETKKQKMSSQKKVVKEGRGTLSDYVSIFKDKFNELYAEHKKECDSHIEKVKASGEFKDLETRLAWDFAHAIHYDKYLPTDEQGFVNANDNTLTTLFKQALRKSEIQY
jgi:hypothetical protein